MASKKKQKSTADGSAGCLKLFKFFKPEATRKRPLEADDEDAAPPSSKRFSPPSAHVTPSPEPGSPLSQEQRLKMEHSKLEAEAKLFGNKFDDGVSLGLSWFRALRQDFKKPYMNSLIQFLKEERSKYTVYPPARDVFSWTLSCAIEEVKVVILGQDPYHGPGQAHGMSFSVRPGVPAPPSLGNIYKELESNVLGFQRPIHGYLMGWANQGVLLLNACLTVREHQPKSHTGKGWEKLTTAVIHWLNSNRRNLVFLLWGKDAQKKGSFIDSKKHCVFKSVHPSPLSAHRGFLGCKHFSQANQYLIQNGKAAINWSSLPLQ